MTMSTGHMRAAGLLRGAPTPTWGPDPHSSRWNGCGSLPPFGARLLWLLSGGWATVPEEGMRSSATSLLSALGQVTEHLCASASSSTYYRRHALLHGPRSHNPWGLKADVVKHFVVHTRTLGHERSPVLQSQKLRIRKVKCLARGYTANERQSGGQPSSVSTALHCKPE